MSLIRTLLVDDEPDIRMVMRWAIEADDGEVSVVGEASDGLSGVSAVAELEPSVVVLDVKMPHLDGLETASRMLALQPGIAIILCSSYYDVGMRREAFAMGVRECVSKTDLVEIPDVIRRVAGAAA